MNRIFLRVTEQLVSYRIQPQAGIPSAKWSWSNKLLQFLANTSDGRGYHQWQQAGRHVKQGSKAFHILGPKIKEITETDDNNQESKKKIVVGFYVITVFRVENTDGKPLPYEPANPPPLADVAERFGLSVSYQTFAGSHYGCYQSDAKRIILATHEAQIF